MLEALALRSELDPKVVRKIIMSSSPKTITALAWKANLSMRTAIQLQSRTARIPPKKLLNARHGTDFPETGDKMLQHLKKMLR